MPLTKHAGTITGEDLTSLPPRRVTALLIQYVGTQHFVLLVQLTGDDRWRAVATRRNPTKPRRFKELDRLVPRMSRNFPKIESITIEIARHSVALRTP